MSRTLSAGVQAAVLENPGHVVHIIEFEVGATFYRFAEDFITFAGESWLPGLRMDSPIILQEKLQLSPVNVQIQNVDLAASRIVKGEMPDLQGATAILSRLFLTRNEAVIIFYGQITAVDPDEDSVELVLNGDMDPTASVVPVRKYAQVNSADGKTLDQMTTDGDENLFDGFLTITRDLTQAIEGQAPDAITPDRALSSLYQQ